MSVHHLDAELLPLPPGTRYHLPDTGNRLPVKDNPFAAEFAPEAQAWARPAFHEIFGPELGEAKLDTATAPRWTGIGFPFADRRCWLWIIRTALAHMAWGGVTTRTSPTTDPDAVRRGRRRFEALVRGERPVEPNPAETLFRAADQDLRAIGSPAFTARFHRIHLDIDTSLNEESLRATGGAFASWDGYVRYRRVNTFGFMLTAMAERSVGADMGGLLAASPEFRAVEATAIDHIMFTNDLHSFAKESKRGEHVNGFWILRREGRSVQEAVDRLAAVAVAKQDEFIARRDALLDGPHGARADVRGYLRALSHLLGGNLHFHRVSPRYQGPGHDGTPVNAGTVTIGEHANTFVPDRRPATP